MGNESDVGLHNPKSRRRNNAENPYQISTSSYAVISHTALAIGFSAGETESLDAEGAGVQHPTLPFQ